MGAGDGGMIIFEIGDVVSGRYRLEQCIGSGGMGAVWRATDLRLFERRVALKFVLPTGAHNASLRQLFLSEATLLARLDHAAICPILGFGDERGVLWLAMGYVDGCDLGKLCGGGGVPVPQVLYVVSQILAGLAHAHERRVVHRDVKPSNVLLSRSGEIKLTDFGIAKMMTGNTGSVPAFAGGSPGYIAPEVLLGGPARFQSDLFAVGAILWELVVGRHPFVVSPDVDVNKILRSTRDESVPTFSSLKI